MNVLEFDGLITIPPTQCGLVKFITTADLLIQNSIKFRTDKTKNGEVVEKMYIIFDNDEDYSAYMLIKD